MLFIWDTEENSMTGEPRCTPRRPGPRTGSGGVCSGPVVEDEVSDCLETGTDGGKIIGIKFTFRRYTEV